MFSNWCWRSCGAHNHTHIYWQCPTQRLLWSKVFNAFKEMFKQKTYCCITRNSNASKYLPNILPSATLKCLKLKLNHAPIYNIWIQKVWALYQMEQITYPLSFFQKRQSPVLSILIQRTLIHFTYTLATYSLVLVCNSYLLVLLHIRHHFFYYYLILIIYSYLPLSGY